MRKIFVINLLISMLFFSLVFIFNTNLPVKINYEYIDNYRHNIFTDLNKLDFRHWAIPLFDDNIKTNYESIYNAIYLSSNQKNFRNISYYKFAEEYQNLNKIEKKKILMCDSSSENLVVCNPEDIKDIDVTDLRTKEIYPKKNLIS